VPFTAAQLEAAIAVRGGSAEIAIEVSSPSPERLALKTRDGRWEIEIGAARGEAAARVVALHVIELGVGAAPVSDGVTRAPGEVAPGEMAPGAVAPGAVAPGAVEVGATARQALVPMAADRYRVAALGVGARGTSAGDFASLGAAIEVTRSGRWIVGGGLGWQHALTIHGDHGAPYNGDLIRGLVLGGVTVGPAERVATGSAGRVIVDGGTGGVNRWSTGIGAEVRVAVPVSAAWAVMIAAGTELFRERIEVRYGDMQIGATARATVGGGIGVAWTGEQVR
jgi:hypothetical protein